MELDPEDKYQVFKAQMEADRKALEAQRAQQEVNRLLLDLEHKYRLLGQGTRIDPRTATADTVVIPRRPNGRSTAEALMLAITGEG